jgi:SAM-dependent methyltransferase
MNLGETDIVKKFQDVVYHDEDDVQAEALSWLLDELKMNKMARVLDFGCGNGMHREAIGKAGGKWFGVDLRSSPEVDRATEGAGNRVVYDGRRLPFRNGCVDVVFTCQVLEHVEDLKAVFNELARISKSGGKVVGSTSHLEPYHSNSLRSITPYGLEKIMEESGFQLRKIRAGVDCFSLVCGRIFPNLLPRLLSRIFEIIIWSPKGSPLNRVIHLWGKIWKIDPKIVECVKLQFSGHMVFQAVRV